MERVKEPLVDTGKPEEQVPSLENKGPKGQIAVRQEAREEDGLVNPEKEVGKANRQKRLKGRHRRQLVLWWSRIIILWVLLAGLGYYAASEGPRVEGLPDIGALATIFFGTSSLALLIVSLVLAFVAIIGWSYVKEALAKEIKSSERTRHELRNDIASNREFMEYLKSHVDSRLKGTQEQANNLAEKARDKASDLEREVRDSRIKAEEYMQAQAAKIRDEVQVKFDKIAKEIKGRANLTSGNTLASSVMTRIQLKAARLIEGSPVTSSLDKNTIEEAIYILDKSYRDLKEAETQGQYASLNNIVYYACVLRLDESREELVSQAKELRAVAEANRNVPWSIPYFITFLWVTLLYGHSAGEIAEALKIGEELIARPDITSFQNEEATDIVASLKGRLKELLS